MKKYILLSLLVGGNCMALQLKSPVFKNNETLPKDYTCDGRNVNPPLEWSVVPKGTKSLVLMVDDPDAPGGTWVHWILFNIPPTVAKLEEHATINAPMKQGKNSFNKKNYGGACPPVGKVHRYFFKLYALDTTLDLPEGSTKEQIEAAMQGHVMSDGTAELIGKYRK